MQRRARRPTFVPASRVCLLLHAVRISHVAKCFFLFDFVWILTGHPARDLLRSQQRNRARRLADPFVPNLLTDREIMGNSLIYLPFFQSLEETALLAAITKLFDESHCNCVSFLHSQLLLWLKTRLI